MSDELNQFIGLAFVENLIIEPQNSERDEILAKGIDLVPNKLILRGFRDKDIEYREKWRLPLPSHHQGLTLVLELSNVPTQELRNEDTLIHRAITAFRMFKAGRVNIDGIIVSHPNPEWAGSYITGSSVQWSPIYYLDISEIENFKQLFDKVKSIDYEKYPSFRIACSRFENTYQSKTYENRIIDFCISFEALFLKGENPQTYRGRGHLIGMSCGMLLGKDNQERNKIRTTIREMFTLRNKIVHGSPMTESLKEKIYEFGYDNVENYLRHSLVKLLP
ncbi:MAG: hypothetical protein ACFFB5_24700 [Promethearchaeota archaeon]